ncbi:MAG: iron uptake system protein EfeO [Dermatophilaceae bacterium]
MRPFRRAHPLVLLPLTALAVAGCSSSGSSSSATTSSAAPGQITVTATDTSCEVSAATAPAGVVTFDVTNSGSKVNEFYVYAEGDRIVGEVENIGPGLTRQLKVEVTDSATLTTACKPGMVGDGIRTAFAVTGSAKAGSANEQVAAAIADYQTYVNEQAAQLVSGTTAFVAAVKAKDVAAAKALYPSARAPWERIEPVAESFGELDPKIDGREDVVNEGMAFTGYHRLEKDLWVGGLTADSDAVADQLLADVNTVAQQSAAADITGLSIAAGAKSLLDEVATGKVTGEEERYSHTDLWDFDGNVQGSQAALAALRPLLQEKDPALLATLDTQFANLNKVLAAHKNTNGYARYTDLTPDQIKALTVALDAVSEPVSRVGAVVERA